MILKDAFCSLKKDLIHSFFYWLTFVISSMFIFLFLVVSMSDGIGVTFVEAKGDLPTDLAVFSAVLCMIEIVFANDFFVKNKAKELAVRLVCGATYVQLAMYLLIQTSFLLICAIPVGIVGGIALLPFLNDLINSLSASSMQITISSSAVIWTIAILGFVIFWTMILNLSFAYRNSAAQLLNTESIRTGSSNPFFVSFLNELKKGKNRTLSMIFSFGLFLIPLVFFYYSPQGTLIFAAVSLLGLNQVFKNFAMPYLNRLIEKNIDHPETVGYIGFVRHDLKILKINVLLLIATSVLLISVLVGTERPGDTILVLICYASMTVLLSLAILFRFSADLSDRVRYYRTLSHIGYMEKEERKIIRKEVCCFYGIVIGLILIYLINLSIALCISGLLKISDTMILMVLSVVPELVCILINLKFYMNVIFERGKEKTDGK